MKTQPAVTLFIQCIVDSVYPEVAEAMVRVLEDLGLSLECPTEQTCCGQPAFNAGHRGAARSAAEKFIQLFEPAEVIVSPSGSCVNMVRNHYPELFADDPEMLARARRIGERTYEFSEYLVDVLQVEELGARYPARVTYHSSCHLNRFLGIDRQPRALLANIEGLQLVELAGADRCCGFGGTFSVKYGEISEAILEEKVDHIIDSGADLVTGCDMGCLMNIQGMLSRKNALVKVIHIAQLLAGK
ncbi:(Fe-S)-binding protein [Desulfogranum mediterraneum]|uniref:(Fe-S)-binding protein n=1 Tax=Desulfogranum mediterraneum TaxID=160661 RepID=UPI0003FB76EF|nr:(Fe-S)-binding protein [Desulfogranum mediterraneum]